MMHGPQNTPHILQPYTHNGPDSVAIYNFMIVLNFDWHFQVILQVTVKNITYVGEKLDDLLGSLIM